MSYKQVTTVHCYTKSHLVTVLILKRLTTQLINIFVQSKVFVPPIHSIHAYTQSKSETGYKYNIQQH